MFPKKAFKKIQPGMRLTLWRQVAQWICFQILWKCFLVLLVNHEK